jgi:CRISPR/Cas system CSM-associated protein Csm2 small subunit
MDKHLIESVLNKIIEIDNQTNDEIEKIQAQIKEKESDLKEAIKDIEMNSNELQIEQGKKLYEAILLEADEEKSKMEKLCKLKLNSMEELYEQKRKYFIEEALKKLSLNHWG